MVYLHTIWLIFMANVGIHISYMDPMGISTAACFWPDHSKPTSSSPVTEGNEKLLSTRYTLIGDVIVLNIHITD